MNKVKYISFFLLLFISGQMANAQSSGKFTVSVESGKSSLINTETNKPLFKNCYKIEALKIDAGNAEADYFFIINKSDVELFSVALEKSILNEKIKNPDDCFRYTSIKNKKAAILEIFFPDYLKTVLLDNKSIIYPTDKALYSYNILYRKNIPDFAVTGNLDKNGIYKEGTIDFSGKEILPMEYSLIADYDIHNKLFIVKQDKKYAAVDHANK